MTDRKPPILKNPRRLLRMLGLLLGLFVVLYAAVAAIGFIHHQTKAPDPRMTESEAPGRPDEMQ